MAGKAKYTQKPLGELAELQVNQSNAIIRSAQTLTLSEKRLIAAALAATDSMSEKLLAFAVRPTETGVAPGLRVRVVAADVAVAFGLQQNHAYTQLRDAGKMLLKRHVRIVDQQGKKERVRLINWVSEFNYIDAAGYCEICFTGQIAPFILGLKGSFTSYKIKEAAHFKSIYSFRLFELCMSWKNKGSFTIDLDEFETVMDAPPSCRSHLSNLRFRILQPAIKEILAKSDWLIDCKAVKAGREVKSLRFTFLPNPQPSLFGGSASETEE